METNEQITPEEQIRNQREEIASQRRRIENLEAELQRYMENPPNKGKYTYEFKPGTGEGALLQQIATLQKELDDCLETSDVGLVRGDLLRSRIERTISGLFLPATVYNEHNQKWDEVSQPWWHFRQFLFDADIFENHWAMREFRRGVDALNDICQATEERPTKIKHLDRFDLSGRLFGGGSNLEYEKERIQAIQSLISSMLIIRENQDHTGIKEVVGAEDLDDMLVTLKIIAYCQRLWLDAKPEPLKQEASQTAE